MLIWCSSYVPPYQGTVMPQAMYISQIRNAVRPSRGETFRTIYSVFLVWQRNGHSPGRTYTLVTQEDVRESGSPYLLTTNMVSPPPGVQFWICPSTHMFNSCELRKLIGTTTRRLTVISDAGAKHEYGVPSLSKDVTDGSEDGSACSSFVIQDFPLW